MHELGITQEIIKVIDREMLKHQGRKVLGITLKIGEMSAVVPDSLRFCFKILSSGTPLEGAELRIISVLLIARCEDCHHKFHVKEFQFLCPLCGSVNHTILSGRELLIEQMEVE